MITDEPVRGGFPDPGIERARALMRAAMEGDLPDQPVWALLRHELKGLEGEWHLLAVED